MNILIDINPNSVSIDNKNYRINTDFRISILFSQLLQDRSLSDKEKMANAINLYFPIKPPYLNTIEGLNNAMDKIFWFYRCGEYVVAENSSTHTKEVFCFEQDANYIYSAFLTQYNIDLQDIEHLHWWKFMALFKSLGEEHLFSKIIGYRSRPITSDMTKEQKEFYREMKQLYEIPDKRTKEEIEGDFVDSLDGLF